MPIDDAALLEPLQYISATSVPHAGHRELVLYHNRVSEERAKFGIFGSLSAAFFILGWLAGGTVPTLAYLLYTFGSASGLKALTSFLSLVIKPKLYRELPEGASEQTAQLEDALVKLAAAWNEDAAAWNANALAWEKEMEELRRLLRYPSGRELLQSDQDFEWAPKTLRTRLDAIRIRWTILKSERGELVDRWHGIKEGIEEFRESSAVPTPVSDP